MTRVLRFGWMPIFVALATTVPAQHHHGGAVFASHASFGHHSVGGMSPAMLDYGHHGGGGLGFPIGAVGGGYAGFGGFGYGYGFPYYYPTPVIVNAPIVFPPIFPAFPAGQGGGGLMLPMPPRQLAANPVRPRRANPDRAKELVEIGDRSFRGGNIHRAEERYFLAAKADPTAPLPYVHLAQVSLVRKDYTIAAERIRTAVDIAQGSGWLANFPDIQTMYGEPGDFARHLATLESHLQTNPGDRDAWFLLGVEWYLSGRTQQAADAFRRLSDRRPDGALAAFLDATNSRRPAAN
jgi:hypothetical protein